MPTHAINVRAFEGLNGTLHKLETRVYAQADRRSAEQTAGLLKSINKARLVQTFFNEQADEEGLVPLDDTADTYLGEMALAMQLVELCVGDYDE